VFEWHDPADRRYHLPSVAAELGSPRQVTNYLHAAGAFEGALTELRSICGSDEEFKTGRQLFGVEVDL
jgi:hypothetical protein